MNLFVRFLCLFLVACFSLASVSFAEETNPLKEVSLDELIATKLMIEAEISSRESEFKTVTVPIGKYTVGLDIPVGIYTLTSAGDLYSFSSIVSVLDQTNQRVFYDQISNGGKIGKLELLYGYQVEIKMEAVIFSTYEGLGF